ncbi:ankyrin repeat domain-containing protein 65-like [Schistocerca gregaria]|uniref:ankyrin repeat domain-containing protein 65-like n=1 Tax=Schistocerca gregaria TaxID=7010 RepID=UPI00211E34F6|nr:ankyrin repeat domain-containing protein 65-like [Schistocerca gregaria]
MEDATEAEEAAGLDIGPLLDAGECSMVTLAAGKTRLAAHRAVLQASSPVLGALVHQDSPEVSSGHITLTDVEGPVLRHLVSYCYTLRAPQRPSVSPQLLAAAMKYGVSGLKVECERTLESSSMGPVAEPEETVALDLGPLLDAGECALVTLEAGKTRLAAHRAVLQARSPVLGALVHQDSPAASSGHTTLTDVEGPVLRHLVSYCYTLRAPQRPSVAPQLLVAADKYGISGLKQACGEQLAARLTVETAAATAVLAVRHSCPSLIADALAFIKANHEVLATQGWSDIVLHQPDDAVEVSRLLGEMAQFRNLSAEEKAKRLMRAAQEGTVEELQELLAAGADVGSRDKNVLRQTALHYAAAKGHVEVVKCLLEGGAEVDSRDTWQETPLHKAAYNGHTAMVQFLVASSADPNASNCCGCMPLHFAADRGHTETTAALLEAGADRLASDKDGNTPKYFAERKNNQQLVEMLT